MEATSKLLNDLLWNIKTEAYSLGVQTFIIFYKSKKLEKLAHILFLYTYSCVNNLDLNHTVFRISEERNKFFMNKVRNTPYQSTDNCNTSATLRKLKSIWL